MKRNAYVLLVLVAFLTLTAAGASRYVNGTEIPNAVTLLYSTGSQSATLGATTATTLGVSGAMTVTGATTHIGAVAVSGALSSTGALSTASTLTVTGASALSGNVGITGTLGVTGAATFQLPPVFASAETGLTAHAGGTQAAALALSATKFMHAVGTVASATDSVALPAPVLGQCHLVVNEAAANALQLFAVTPATVNGVATATGVALSAKKGTLCCADSTTDYACSGPN